MLHDALKRLSDGHGIFVAFLVSHWLSGRRDLCVQKGREEQEVCTKPSSGTNGFRYGAIGDRAQRCLDNLR